MLDAAGGLPAGAGASRSARPRRQRGSPLLPPVLSASLQRVAGALATLVVLVTLVFFLARMAPGGPAYAILGLRATPTSVGAVDLRLGLDVPLWKQYAIYWVHLAQGDLGTSYLLNRSVASLLVQAAARTLTLFGSALVLGTLLAIAGGLAHGVWFTERRGRLLAMLELVLYALPSFFVGTALMAVFATGLGWLPAGGAANLRLPQPGVINRMGHLILPVVTVALAVYAGLAPYFAQSVHHELQAGYARTALAKGFSLRGVLFRHVFRNAARPLVTMIGLAFPSLVAGSVVVESVFSYPGLGWLLWRSAIARDYPVIVGIVLLIGVATIIGNLAAELVNTWLDPRARYV